MRVAALIGLGTLAGCQAIAGVESRQLDPIIEGPCVLPTQGNAKIRFGNLVPDDDVVDLCVRPSGGAYGRPIVRYAGSQCAKTLGGAAGFKYLEFSAPFAVQAGKIDVKVVAAGQTCGGPTLTEGLGLDVAAGETTSVVRIGNEKGQSIKVFVDDTTPTTGGNSKLRLVHAAPGLDALDWAVTTSTALPADMGFPITKQPIAYGQATNAAMQVSVGHLNPTGYIELPGTALNVASAPTGAKKALLLATLERKETGRTLYAVGDPTKPLFPVRGLLCNDADAVGLKTDCKPTQLGTISVDMFNAYLYGGYAKDEDDRRAKVIETIANRDSDIMCVVSLNRKKDRDGAIKAAADAAGMGNKGFKYAYYPEQDMTTGTDAPDQSGKAPPAFTTPPCGGDTDPAKVDAVIQCMQESCSTTHTPDGQLAGGSSCLSSNCAVALIPFLGGDRNAKRCFNCLTVGAVSDETHATLRDVCLNQVVDYKAFRGQSDSVILSKYPLTNTETLPLPTTSYRRNVQYAQVEIEKGKFIDFYCGEYSAAYGELLPYFGNYAPDAMPDPWSQEELLQAKRTVEWVKAKSAGKPAIITGEWVASREYKDGTGKVTVSAVNPAIYDILEAPGAFIPALPKGFVPQCTQCPAPANPYNADQNVWQFRTYVYNLPVTSGVEVNYFATDLNAVTTSDGRKVPVTDRWGFNTRVLRP